MLHLFEHCGRRSVSIVIALLLGLALTAGVALAQRKPTIKLGYVQGWSSNVASISVVAAVIRDRLGYPVSLISLDAGPMWQGVSEGDIDATVSAWLPTTHAAYYKKLWSKVINLGPNLYGTRIGLVVPDYVTVDSIPDLKQHRAQLRGQIIGIDPGAGIMMKTQAALKAYGLNDFNLVQSSGAAMTAALARAEKRRHWIVITGWTPHWMWAKWKLKYLQDPKGVYGDGGHINTVINPGLVQEAMPVVDFLKRFQWTTAEMGQVMLAIQNGAEAKAAAEKWVKDHPKLVSSWLE